MPIINIETIIKCNDINRCFDLARSIDLHKETMQHTNEKAISGRTNGLIELNETVTWEAKHFGVVQQLTSRITQFEAPIHFRDEQEKGIFKYLIHDHFFELKSNEVIMIDQFNYEAPLGFLGRIAEQLFLNQYLNNLLKERNNCIKQYAETDKWESILK